MRVLRRASADVGPASQASILSALPADLREALRSAVEKADLEEIYEIAARLAGYVRAAAARVRDRVDRFEYEALLQLLGTDR